MSALWGSSGIGPLIFVISVAVIYACNSVSKPPKPSPTATQGAQAFKAWFAKYGVSYNQFLTVTSWHCYPETTSKLYSRLSQCLPADNPFICHSSPTKINMPKEYREYPTNKRFLEGTHLSLLYWASYGKVVYFAGPREFGFPDYMREPDVFWKTYIYLLEQNGVEDLFWITDTVSERQLRILRGGR